MSRRALVGLGDVNDVLHWGGHPYFFLQAGRRNGLFEAGITLHLDQLRRRQLVWNLLRMARLERPGGSWYAGGYLRRAWAGRTTPPDVAEYVSHFPLVPPRELVNEPVVYYIDATMRQNLDGFVGRRIGKRIV